MEGINYTIAFGMWLGMAVIAIANGYIGNTYVTPRLGDYGNHVYKTLFMIPVIFLFSWLYANATRGETWLASALFVSCFWLGLTILFEFVFGHYVLRNSWEVLIADYRIWRGRLWLLVLISDAIAPVTIAWLING
ncbi:MAG: hypothetical protein QNJ72_29505 [Pleurocapsa sp. MO_226.B13]|nr:hypothetical protein [Pleurocapsa sp. MO_226.B13]